MFHSRIVRFVLASLLGTEGIAMAGPSGSQEEAQRWTKEAFRRLAAHDHAGGIDALERAYAAVPHVNLIFNLAVAYDEWGGHCAESLQAFERFFKACDACKHLERAKVRFEEVRHRCSSDVVIETSPQGATVDIDGVRTGTTPLARRLLIGPHFARLRLEGFFSEEAAFTLEPNSSHRIERVLRAEDRRARLVLDGIPPGATARLDGAPVEDARSPIPVAAGSHRIEIRAGDELRVLEVSAAESEIVHLDFADARVAVPSAAARALVPSAEMSPPREGDDAGLSPWAWASFATAVAGAAAGTAFSVLTLNDLSAEKAARMPPVQAPDVILDHRRDAQRDALYAHVGFGVALGAAAVGALFLVFEE